MTAHLSGSVPSCNSYLNQGCSHQNDLIPCTPPNPNPGGSLLVGLLYIFLTSSPGDSVVQPWLRTTGLNTFLFNMETCPISDEEIIKNIFFQKETKFSLPLNNYLIYKNVRRVFE